MKRIIFLVVTLLGVFAALTTAQTVNYVTLPNGEKVVDISGQWNTLIENYGPWAEYGSYPGVIKIVMNGSTFVGIRMKPTKYHAAGKLAFRGEIDKDGIKNFQIMTASGQIDSKAQILEDGNKIINDDGEKARGTLTRAGKNICYDLNGKWDAVYDTGGWGVYEDAMRITHKDDQFVGIYLYKGDNMLGKKQEKIKGKTCGDGFEKVYFHVVDPDTFELFWDTVKGSLSEDGNEILIKRVYDHKGATITQTLKMKRR